MKKDYDPQALQEETAALARDVKKRSRAAKKLFEKVGWTGFRLYCLLIRSWLEDTEPGALVMQVPEVCGDHAAAVALLIDLHHAGLVNIVYEPGEENTGISIIPCSPEIFEQLAAGEALQ